MLDLAGQAVRAGVTTDEIDRITHEACVDRNCYPSPLNYYNFPKVSVIDCNSDSSLFVYYTNVMTPPIIYLTVRQSVCTSVNEIICHGIPDTRDLQDGDIVNIDVTTYVVYIQNLWSFIPLH